MLVFFSGSKELARATLRCSSDVVVYSQAAAVGGDEEGGRDDIHEDEHHLKQSALVVCVRVSRLADISGGTGADLSVTAKSDDRGPDEPCEGGKTKKGVKDARKDEQLLVVDLFVDHLKDCDSTANKGEVETSSDDVVKHG